jgi:hypothetical protein
MRPPRVRTGSAVALCGLAAIVLSACVAHGPGTASSPSPMSVRPAVAASGGNVSDPSVEGPSDRFFARPPDCVVVVALPWSGAVDVSAPLVEAAVARRLSDRVERVIGPAEREAIGRRLAVGLGDARDRRDFERLTGCGHVMEVRPLGPGSETLSFWAERRVGLAFDLVEIGRERPVWTARGVSTRADGGLPFSVLGAIGAAVRADRFWNDADVQESLVDDLLRRLVRSLPDTRYRGAVAGGGGPTAGWSGSRHGRVRTGVR